MKQRLVWLVVGLLVLLGAAQPAVAQREADVIASLPAGEAIYGLGVSPDGLLYAGEAANLRAGTIFVYTPGGALVQRIVIPAGPTGLVSLRGMAFDRLGNLYVADTANGQPDRGRIIKVSASGRQSIYASGLTAPTGLALDRSGILYVNDGLNGAILWIGPDGAWASFVEDQRLQPGSHRGLGASGLVFASDESALYVTNTSEDRILRLAINPDGSAGRLTVLVDGQDLRDAGRAGALDGPEGLAVDTQGNLLVAVSRSDEIEAYSPRGRFLGRVPANGGSGFSWPTGVAQDDLSVYVASLAVESGQAYISRFPLSDLYAE